MVLSTEKVGLYLNDIEFDMWCNCCMGFGEQCGWSSPFRWSNCKHITNGQLYERRFKERDRESRINRLKNDQNDDKTQTVFLVSGR